MAKCKKCDNELTTVVQTERIGSVHGTLYSCSCGVYNLKIHAPGDGRAFADDIMEVMRRCKNAGSGGTLIVHMPGT